MASRKFHLPEQGRVLVFSEAVLTQMYAHAQVRWFQQEAGGQLFCSAPECPDILVDAVTGPHRKDQRTRHGWVPDVQQATIDRHQQFNAGRHAVGLWHTHPEPMPSPSTQDLQTASEYLQAFGDSMDGFLLVILGNAGVPLNMDVWLLHRVLGRDGIRLREELDFRACSLPK
ncbi:MULTISPECIES: Mov34/MPN/PAD-1 family protein [unclassified Duganella]|uniref:Mov34/MPN/PAD-1 family protein n=1 Tax=unclassified Duganella TaxID=2636909 RepID=UPI001314C61E|nr:MULTISPECIES: Mov34/MPN/PAD-1 family protein [unclassified Duganella]